MCADCHSSQVTKGYDAAKDAFDDSLERDLGRLRVVSRARLGSCRVGRQQICRSEQRADGTARRAARRQLAHRTGDRQRDAQPRAHERARDRGLRAVPCEARADRRGLSRRAALHRPLPAGVAHAGAVHVDGQQRDEVFIWGSWLQSRMHRMGVTCSDCHEPHSQRLRVEGNAVCGQCHAAGKFDSPAHHHHPAGTAGAQCVGCHMPQTTYMVVDAAPRSQHARAAPGPVGHARRAEWLQCLPSRPLSGVGCGRGARLARPRRARVPTLRLGVPRGRSRAGRGPRFSGRAGGRRRPAADRARLGARTPRSRRNSRCRHRPAGGTRCPAVNAAGGIVGAQREAGHRQDHFRRGRGHLLLRTEPGVVVQGPRRP